MVIGVADDIYCLDGTVYAGMPLSSVNALALAADARIFLTVPQWQGMMNVSSLCA